MEPPQIGQTKPEEAEDSGTILSEVDAKVDEGKDGGGLLAETGVEEIKVDEEGAGLLERGSREFRMPSGIVRSNSVDDLIEEAKRVSKTLDSQTKARNNRQAFMRKLLAFVVATLTTSAKLPAEGRAEVLKDLARNLSVRVETRVLENFVSDGSIPSTESFGNRNYYNLTCEEIAANIELYGLWRMDSIVAKLRSSEVFHDIYAMVFHQWLLFSKLATVKDLNLFLEGARRLFRKDRDSCSFTYRLIYQKLRRMLAKNVYWTDNVKALLIDLWGLWASYCFFYEKEAKNVGYNLKHFMLARLLSNAQDDWGVVVMQHDAGEDKLVSVVPAEDSFDVRDLFVRLVVKQLPMIRHERVMVRYLKFCGALFSVDFKLSQTTSIMLQSELYARSKEGNPYYCTPRCREAAYSAMNQIYPSGVVFRTLVALAFRLSQPYYALRALVVFIYAAMWPLLLCRRCRRPKKE